MNSLLPILAEIADKMPSLDEVWRRSFILGAIVAMLTAAFSMIRLWLGGVMVIPCFILGILAASSGGVMDQLVVRELGSAYLHQERISCFVPCGLASLAWLIVWLTQRSVHNSTGGR
ncbi:hypothetical protein OKA04_05950 [Luteolibacter flavescens]|uniref:Uncharacterized protein n=1 Tax=Luteolibacter flavescens TaxID=1859460 RepID=A0ABT3FL29_9BACT|nr:hypothetical protein [Luteolibacter flavescens]MCW1884266.1 hypothetical protein [Luteolibacter flavescens]